MSPGLYKQFKNHCRQDFAKIAIVARQISFAQMISWFPYRIEKVQIQLVSHFMELHMNRIKVIFLKLRVKICRSFR